MVTTRSGVCTMKSFDGTELKGRKQKSTRKSLKIKKNTTATEQKVHKMKLQNMTEICKELPAVEMDDLQNSFFLETSVVETSTPRFILDISASPSAYDMTINPELVDLEEKEYRKDKKIPSWAKDGPGLHMNLFMQQPHLVDCMSSRCFPNKETMNLRLL